MDRLYAFVKTFHAADIFTRTDFANSCPSADTLARLELRDGCQQWLGHDVSRLDLSSSVAMKYLAATASFFVAQLLLGNSRIGLYSLLPRSLEKLHVSGMENLV